MMSSLMHPRWVLGFTLLLVTAGGCGYSTERPFKTGVRNVHVEMFHTKEFWRDLEFRLSEALVKRIEMDTPYEIVDRKVADSVISGEVLEVKQAVLGEGFRTGLPRETGVTFVVTFRWQDLRTGEDLATREALTYTTTYIRPVGETFFDGTVRGLDGLAERIVEVAMESNW